MERKLFLTGEWRNLIMANYLIDPAILQSFVPAKTELDYWNNNCYVSLVGFMFEQTRVKGIKIPFHVNFPEVNLRFYVRYKEDNEWKRGVVFISEIVPKPAICFIANTLFGEHYASMPMKYKKHIEKDGALSVEYKWKKNKQWNSISVAADAAPGILQAGSEEEFITEHFWGYTSMNDKRTGEYKVAHPRWNIHRVTSYNIDCDFGLLYGSKFNMLETQKPASVFLAEGSAIKVFSKKVL
jgi:uncharacterized protein YqjF (DUF2071 family)